jgi:exodeoxyribonuclease V alpha subunit
LQPDELPYLEKYGFAAATENLLDQPLVAAPGEAKQPFILFKERLYLQRYYAYESSIVQSIVSLVAAGKVLRDQRIKELQLHRAFIESLGAGMDAGEPYRRKS